MNKALSLIPTLIFASLLLAPLTQSYSQQPNQPASTGEPDPALDHAATKKASTEALRGTGVADPAKGAEPVHVSYFHSGKFPQDTYYFIVGCNGKVYGQGQNPPKGKNKLLELSLSKSDEEWIATAIISHNTANFAVYDAMSVSGGDSDALLPSEQGQGFRSDEKNYARWRNFKAKDPSTAARAAIVDLYSKGYLYDVEKNYRENAAEAEARLKPMIEYIRGRIQALNALYAASPDNPAKRTLLEAFKKEGVSGKALEYADNWSGWLSSTWGDLSHEFTNEGFYGYHLNALVVSLQSFKAQGYARQADLLSLKRWMESFKKEDERAQKLLQDLVWAYANKAKVYNHVNEANDYYWEAKARIEAMQKSNKITVKESLTQIDEQAQRRDTVLVLLKEDEEDAGKDIGRIIDALRDIAQNKRFFLYFAEDAVKDECGE